MVLDPEKATRHAQYVWIEGCSAEHDLPQLLPLDQILIRLNAKGRPANITRTKLDETNVSGLETALKVIDYALPLPVVKKLENPIQVNGQTYLYELIVGVHRVTALRRNGTKEWLFDVYKFETEQAEYDLQDVENDHPTNKGHTPDGLAKSLTFRVNKGWIENTEVAFKDYLKVLKNVPHQTINAAVKKAVRLNGAFQAYKVYDYQDVKDYLENNDNYDETTTPYSYGGAIDTERNEIGYSVKEGYVNEYVMNAARALVKHDKPSYFIGHTGLPTEKKPLKEKRGGLNTELNAIETALEASCNFKTKHGVWPWRFETLLPQNYSEGEEESGFIPVKKPAKLS